MHAILEVRNLSPQERVVMEALLRTPDPVSQRELMSRMRDAPSQATMSRVMSGLIARGLLAKEGQTRGARFSLPPDVRRVATDPRRRTPIPYDPDRIGGYVPNETRWLPEESAGRMQVAVDGAGMQRLDASTWSRAIAERFLVDLSWASSNLEGNTYDHLSTELLVKYGQSASGRDPLETVLFPDLIRSGRQVSSRIVSCTDCRIFGTIREAGTGLLAIPFPAETFPGSSSRQALSKAHPDGQADPERTASGRRLRRPRLRTRKGVARANGSSPGRGRAAADPIRNEAFRRGIR